MPKEPSKTLGQHLLDLLAELNHNLIIKDQTESR